MSQERESFGTSFGMLVALAGSAVGLGNLWRFPYLMGQNGGAAFIIIYLIFVFILCLPIFMSEFMLGRKAQVNAFKLYKQLAPGTNWKYLGIFNFLAPIFVLSFYCVVGGWTVKYLVESLTFTPIDAGQLDSHFTNFITSGSSVIYTMVFLLLTAGIVIFGIQKGIEKVSKALIPVLFLLVLIIAIYNIFLPGSGAGYDYLLKPDFSKVTGHTFAAALGQAFFSLSLGCGTILTYASYSSKSVKILKMSIGTIISDTMFALIAGCAIIPAVFAYGLNVQEGPGLVFITLPNVFGQMPAGSIVAVIFFFILLLAALTSSISLFEVVATVVIEKFKTSRIKAVLSSVLLFAILSTLCALSEGALSDVKLFGMNIFDFADYASSNIIMTFGVLTMVLFVGWKMPKKDVLAEFTNNGTLGRQTLYNTIYFIIKYLAPIVVLAVIVVQLFG